MARRKGAGKGKGRGYKNLLNFPKDPKVHSQSARGRKQPQRIPHILKLPKYDQIKVEGEWYNQNPKNDNEVLVKGKWKKVYYKKDFSGEYRFSPKQSQKELEDKKEIENMFKDTDGDGVPDYKDCDPNDPTKQADSKIFHVKPNIEIVAHYEKTRSGFRHIAVLYVDGEEVDRAKATYQNRTWESYEFETAIKNLLDKTTYLTEDEKQGFLDKSKRKDREEVESRFRSVGAVAQMGEIFCSTQKEKNDWKKRMLKAGISNLNFPDDWDSLSEDEKEKRLNNVIELHKK